MVRSAAKSTKAETATFPGLEIIGGKDCEKVTRVPEHDSTFSVGKIRVRAIHTPCHTRDSICWFMQDGEQRVVFTGDTLFIGGCGRFFEGNARDMHRALQSLASLPGDTQVFPGHEYTKQNVKFLKTVAPNAGVDRLEAFASAHEHTQGRFTIADEKVRIPSLHTETLIQTHNVFLRVEDAQVQRAVGKSDAIGTMQALRDLKNAFK